MYDIIIISSINVVFSLGEKGTMFPLKANSLMFELKL